MLAQMTQILYEVRSLATQRAQKGFILAQMAQIVFWGDVPVQRLYRWSRLFLGETFLCNVSTGG